jgi:hypothetical protein
MMDCRVKPGNDDFCEQSYRLLLRRNGIVMRGLDPRIHRSSQESFEVDGLPGQARQ